MYMLQSVHLAESKGKY